MAELDNRLLRVSVDVRGRRESYEDVAITVSGTKYANTNQGECNISIANLRKETTDYILSETAPFRRNRTNIPILVEAGRDSTGFSTVYVGSIFRSSISQPPDSVMSMRCLNLQFNSGQVVSKTMPAQTSVADIARSIADDLGLSMIFEADEKQIANYSFTGAANKQLERLEEMGNFDVFTDNQQMFVKNRGQTLIGRTRDVNIDNGLIGVPTLTETGARLTLLYDANTVVGGRANLVSAQYPGSSGQYSIYKIDYELTNRDVPFYNVAHCIRINQ